MKVQYRKKQPGPPRTGILLGPVKCPLRNNIDRGFKSGDSGISEKGIREKEENTNPSYIRIYIYIYIWDPARATLRDLEFVIHENSVD